MSLLIQCPALVYKYTITHLAPRNFCKYTQCITHTHTHMHMRTHTHTRTCAHTLTRTRTHTHTHTHTHTQYTHTRTHTHTHTHKVHTHTHTASAVLATQPVNLYLQYLSLPCRWIRQNKFHLPVRLFLVSSMAVSCLISLCFLGVATLNYPGGEAMARLHQMASPHQLQSKLM